MAEPILTINCLTDHTTDGPDLAMAFEESLNALENELLPVTDRFKLQGDVDRVYIQFQYDCGKLPNTVRGSRITPYSKKYRDIQAFREVTKDEFTSVAPQARVPLLQSAVIALLQGIAERLSGKLDTNIADLAKQIGKMQPKGTG